jgi:hypothetical protein
MEPLTKAPHFFTETVLDLVKDLGLENLLNLSYFADLNATSSKFDLLRDAVRKLQWVDLSYNQAKNIHGTLSGIDSNQCVLVDPGGQLGFSKSLYELIVHGKSSLDSLAQFVAQYFSLPVKQQSADFKWAAFRERFETLAISDGLMGQLEYWLSKDSETIDSISATRDNWIHRGFITIPLLWPPNELGCFGIARRVDSTDALMSVLPLSEEFYFHVDNFLKMHRDNLFKLVSVVIEEAVRIEAKDRVSAPVDINLTKYLFFPYVGTVGQLVTHFKFGPFTAT